MKRYFAILTDQKDIPSVMNNKDHQRFLLLGENHPTPKEIISVMKVYQSYTFLYLFKGEFNTLTKDNIQFLKYDDIRKYNCSTFGLDEGPCKEKKTNRV